jgi:hypothetical protein
MLFAGTALAQPPGFGRPRNPTVSPYLNLLNNRNTPEFNYYQLYRPQTEFRSAYQGLNQNLFQTDSRVTRQSASIDELTNRLRPGSTLGTTGHRATFMNYGSYFGTSAPGAFGANAPAAR